jgi:hypothetical protein
MHKWYFNLFLFDPLALFSGNETDPEKLQLIRINAILLLILCLIVGWEIWKLFQRKKNSGGFFRLMKKIDLKIVLQKDRLFHPQVLTLTIFNSGKNEADLNAPVLEFRKIWSTRKFKLNGINGQQVYPLFLQPGIKHQLQIETSTFHQYDRSIKDFYWARIYVSDIEGRKWKSNNVKLRKSLVT